MSFQQYADQVIIAEAMFCGCGPEETSGPGAIAIQGKQIVAVATSEKTINPWVGPQTKVYRFDKNVLVMPGICDAHLHLEMTIIAETGPQLRLVPSEEECVAIVKTWAEAHPEVPWIIACGWHFSNWAEKKPPDKKLLNEAVPDRPVCLMDVDFHAAWVNDKALAAMGYNKRNIDYGIGGIIHLDAAGEPTGYLEEGPSLDLYNFASAELFRHPEIRKQQMLAAQDIFHQFGITSVMNALNTTEPWLKTLEELRDDQQLQLRINTTLLLNDDPDYLIKGADLARRYPDPKSLLYFWGYKLLADGVGGIHTAWLTEPYSDRPDTCGYPLAKPELMREWVLDVEKRGFGVHVHAVGNKAVEFSLDTFAEAEALGYIKKQRNSITHCDLVNDRDFPRFREHHIVAALQPAMLAPQAKWQDNLHPSHFGERMKNAWAVKRIYEQAAAVSFSSDSPVTVINPMNNIFAATQRIHADGNPPGGIYPEQKVSVAQCLYAYTYGGAYQLGKESWVGSLAVGKIADICVLDHNIFNIPPEQYKAVRSCFTMINGQVVYEKPVENR